MIYFLVSDFTLRLQFLIGKMGILLTVPSHYSFVIVLYNGKFYMHDYYFPLTTLYVMAIVTTCIMLAICKAN